MFPCTRNLVGMCIETIESVGFSVGGLGGGEGDVSLCVYTYRQARENIFSLLSMKIAFACRRNRQEKKRKTRSLCQEEKNMCKIKFLCVDIFFHFPRINE
jgi:hypothetical protein